jgi:aspartate racemase
LKTLGIVGGMGPLATADFYYKVIEARPAADDPQHIPVVMVADTQIPLRIPAWEGSGESPLPALRKAAAQCVAAGATVLAMPCNTAHYWYEAMVQDLPPHVRFIHIAEATLAEMKQANATLKHIALTGTHVTVDMNLYPDAAKRVGHQVQWLLPDAAQQLQINEAIWKVKAGRIEEAVTLYQHTLDAMSQQGAQAIVMACTELPVIASRMKSRMKSTLPLIDATACLARACVAACVAA